MSLSDSMEVTAALMGVRGVLNSCARASSMVDFNSSLWRAASARVAASCAWARSRVMAVRLPMACSAVSDTCGALDSQASHRLPSQADGNDRGAGGGIVKHRSLQGGVAQPAGVHGNVVRARAVNAVAGPVIKRQARQAKDLGNGIGNLLRQGTAHLQQQQIAAQGVELFHLVLAAAGFLRLLPDAGGKMAGDNRRHHKGGERHPVLRVGNGERSDGGRKKKLKQSMAATEATSASTSPQRVAIASTTSRNDRATVTLFTPEMRK